MLKRLFDLFVSFTLLIVLSPVLLIISISVAFSMGRPVIFKHNRPGLNGSLFCMYKFRTMQEPKPCSSHSDSHENRITPYGRFLRSTSLDELPELFNVLRGDMSLVGPRPLLKEYLPLYSSEQKRRHNVRPGITGWAQVNGRNAISWQEKFKLDVWYVNNMNMLLDLKILLMTVKKVVIRENISPDQQSDEMQPFSGNTDN